MYCQAREVQVRNCTVSIRHDSRLDLCPKYSRESSAGVCCDSAGSLPRMELEATAGLSLFRRHVCTGVYNRLGTDRPQLSELTHSHVSTASIT